AAGAGAERYGGMLARSGYEGEDIFAQRRVHVNLADIGLDGHDLQRIHDRLYGIDRLQLYVGFHYSQLVLRPWIAHRDSGGEPVELGFGKRVGARKLYVVLCRDDEK